MRIQLFEGDYKKHDTIELWTEKACIDITGNTIRLWNRSTDQNDGKYLDCEVTLVELVDILKSRV